MYIIRCFAVLLLLYLPGCALAQYESSIWFDRFAGFDFKTFPPQPLPVPDVSLYQSSRGSVADKNGNLLFFSDGVHCYDRRGIVMPNGKGVTVQWGSTELPCFIAAVPGSESKFYLFLNRTPRSTVAGDSDRSLRYWVIDISANGGYGDVIEKDVVIMQNARDYYELLRLPGDSKGFWIVNADLGTGFSLFTHRITDKGVAGAPVVTHVQGGVENDYLKTSPDGKYLAVRIGQTRALAIFAFNSSTGEFAPFRTIEGSIVGPNRLEIFGSPPEFSSDSRMLYVMKDSVYKDANTIYTQKTLLCYDLNSRDQDEFNGSRKVVHKYPDGLPATSSRMQLTPQRKIIVPDVSRTGYFGVIHFPNACAVEDKGFQLQGVQLPIAWYPQTPFFPAWYFYEPSDVTSQLVGKDTLVCPLTNVTLGRNAVDGYNYEWEAGVGLSDPFSANPGYLTPPNTSGANDTTRIAVSVMDKSGCRYSGSLIVATKPVDKLDVFGSNSVCPGANGVKYWTRPSDDAPDVNWTIHGGSTAVSTTDTIIVDWGGPDDAWVEVHSTNVNGCKDESGHFDVSVSPELDTPIPNGPTVLRCNEFREQYQISGTTGSQYHWEVLNGHIISGQGTSRVEVEWDKNSQTGAIWINEMVTTPMENCSGRSDALSVINPKQMGGENISFHNLSGLLESPEDLRLAYELRKADFYQNEILVQRRDDGGDWLTTGKVSSLASESVIPGQPLSQAVFQYRLIAFNTCGDSAISNTHKNILLTEQYIDPQNHINLSWNAHESWPAGLREYRVYRKLDNESGFSERAITNATNAAAGNNSNGFIHRYYVEAFSADGRYSSISNVVSREFEHALFIPNVITPNNDQKNDTWEPQPLEVYPEAEVEIFNRWGQIVFRQNPYRGGWNGEGLPTGTYFYLLKTKRGQFKGFVQVLRGQ